MKAKKEPKIKAVFFDFDLTLADTRKFIKKSYEALCRASGIKPSKKGFDAYAGKRVSENIDFFFKKGKKGKSKLYKVFFKAHEGEEKDVKIYGKEVLSYLKRERIKIIIISNNSKRIIKKVLQHNNMHFDKIIADEDLKKRWEKHEAILKEIKKLKINKNEVLYVGDHLNDIREAEKAGIKIASVTTGVFSREELEKHHPDYLIRNLNELKGIV